MPLEAEAAWAGSALALVGIAFVGWEEAYLERKFGEDYRSFKARTRRWL